MPLYSDLGGTPASEPCAQLGQTPSLAALNRLEVEAYRCAITARFGLPPSGCRFSPRTHRHDFGDYVTLALLVEDAADEAAMAYADTVEEGLDSWLEAGFRAPVDYDGVMPVAVQADRAETLISAFHITRPDADGRFPLAAFARLHQNLAAAFPAEAAIAAARLGRAGSRETGVARGATGAADPSML